VKFDELQSVWNSQNDGRRLTVDSETLRKILKRSHRQFTSTIFWRDLRETVAALFVVAWIVWSRQIGWGPIVLAVSVVVSTGFLLVDRWRHRSKTVEKDECLENQIQSSLFDVNHQIWLLRNVHWLLVPLVVGWSCCLVWGVMRIREPGMTFYILLTIYAACALGFFYFVYLLNQKAVKKDLEPRRAELESLLATLRSET